MMYVDLTYPLLIVGSIHENPPLLCIISPMRI